jgi:hypothetical protein
MNALDLRGPSGVVGARLSGILLPTCRFAQFGSMILFGQVDRVTTVSPILL